MGLLGDAWDWVTEGRMDGNPDSNEDNFKLKGQKNRGEGLLQQADFAAGRKAPGIAGSQYRDDQSSLIGMLQRQAAGEGPSMAGKMLKDALGRNVSTQQALLATGSGPGAARSASMQASSLGGSIANQAAGARIQEMNSARGLLSQTLQGARGLDLQRNQAISDHELRSRGLNDAQIARMRELELRNANMGLNGSMGFANDLTRRRGQDASTPTSFERFASGAGAAAAAYTGIKSVNK